MTSEKLIQEAVKRLKFYDFPQKIVNDFLKGIIWQSNYDSSLSIVTDQDAEFIKEFEEKRGYKIYHVVKTNNENITAFLYVSNYPENWEIEYHEDVVIAYVRNSIRPYFSESSSIIIKKTGIGSLKYLE